jgi:hypothetical protein
VQKRKISTVLSIGTEERLELAPWRRRRSEEGTFCELYCRQCYSDMGTGVGMQLGFAYARFDNIFST